MPPAKHVTPLPRFYFVTQEIEAEDTGWFKTRSGAARRHAAYWGGPGNRQYKAKKQTLERHEENTISDGSIDNHPSRCDSKLEAGRFASLTKRTPASSKPQNVKAVCVTSRATSKFPYHVESNDLQYLPSVPTEIRNTGSPFATGSLIFDFYGESFVKQFLRVNHDDHDIMFSGCILLSYAHYMALTGRGTKTVMLELKGQVIRRLTAKMASSNDLLSPQCLTAILALGAPIVCLVSRDLPQRLGIAQYIRVAMEEDYLCCQQSADAAQRSLDETLIHRQAMRRFLVRGNRFFKDTDSLTLLRYVSNCINITMAIDAVDCLNSLLSDVGDLFPAIRPFETSPIPEHWTSPLTRQWVDGVFTTRIEAQLVLLAGLMHRWLATFLDGENDVLAPTEELLEERANLRQRLEGFAPGRRDSYAEAEAMYECCRWASLILLGVEKSGIPIHVAATYVRIKPRLIRRLRMTDLTNLWGTRRGLLFWVAATCQSATAGQCFPLLCTTLFARFVQEIAMSGSCFEIAIKPLTRLKLFENLCCHPQPAGKTW